MVFYVQTMRATPAEAQKANEEASALGRRGSRITSEAAGIPSRSPRPSLSAASETPPTALPPAFPSALPQQARHNILLVEDNLVNQKVLTKQLVRAGCNVHTANHGQEALDFLKTTEYWRDNNGIGVEVSVILMDCKCFASGKEDVVEAALTCFCDRGNASQRRHQRYEGD